MKTTVLGLALALAAFAQTEVITLTPQETAQLAQLQAAVDAADKAKALAWRNLDEASVRIKKAHGVSGPLAHSGWLVGGSSMSNTFSCASGVLFDKNYKYLVRP